MVDLIKPHDKYFRAAMQNDLVALAFFQHHLPDILRNGLDLDTLEQQDSSYVHQDLQETLSDIVYDCSYKEAYECLDGSNKKAKVILLVEHQSSPDLLMPFRVYHYKINMLYKQLKEQSEEQSKDKLPAVYALVFYHGKQTPYPYSMNLGDCFFDPLGMMHDMFPMPVPLIDINQITDDELKQQQLLGIMTGTLKHSRDVDFSPFIPVLAEMFKLMDLSKPQALNFSLTSLHYLIKVGNIVDVEQLIQGIQNFPEPIRGELMTAAEKLQAMGEERGEERGLKKGEEKGLKKGEERGEEKGLKKVAINSLKEGVDPKFVARITGLEMAVILKLKAELEEDE
jgi:predicted transposase/invertase (TIGR01784 family)